MAPDNQGNDQFRRFPINSNQFQSLSDKIMRPAVIRLNPDESGDQIFLKSKKTQNYRNHNSGKQPDNRTD
jgi:hypothetical protein